MRLALFDLDGTLVDSRHTLAGYATDFAGHHGFDPAEVEQVVLTTLDLPWPERMAVLRTRFASGRPGGRRAAGPPAGGSARWMVGDSAPADIAGARAAGLRSAWLHLGRRWDDALAIPEAWAVRTADELPDLTGLTPDHVVDDVAAAVSLLLQND